jgi:phosphoribosyl 1,2-cyclic phosphodiesterase
MRLLICGSRGSTPAPGADFARYGGETSCIAVARDGEPPRLVIDAGTGLRHLSRALDGAAFHGTVLLGHLHWDHTHGLPFFSAGDRPDASVHVVMPMQDTDALSALTRCMSPPHFPITPRQLRGTWRFDGIEQGFHSIEGFAVLAREIPHKGGRTFGYRVSDGVSTIAYLSDHGPFALGPGSDGLGEFHDAALELAHGVDLLIHDAQHTASEFAPVAHFGHSAIEYAIGLAERSGVSRLLLFHHDPWRTDDALDALVAHYRRRFPALDAAVEGSVVDVPAPVSPAASV